MNRNKLAGCLLVAFLFISCNIDGTSDRVESVEAPNETEQDVFDESEAAWAKENFDLLAVSNLLDESEDVGDFEKRINENDGVNNIDLNGDGFVDYISVEEFENRTDDQRGFTLLSRFGPNEVQEIASFIFGRDRPDRRRSR